MDIKKDSAYDVKNKLRFSNFISSLAVENDKSFYIVIFKPNIQLIPRIVSKEAF